MKKEGKRASNVTGGGILAGLIRRYFSHDVGRDSAALTYYLLFAIFPLLVFISTLLGLLHLDVENIVAVVAQLAPEQVTEIIRSYLIYVSDNPSRQLFWFSLIFSVWFPMRATSCLMHSLRKAYGADPPENIWRGPVRTLIFTVLLIVTIAASLMLSTVGRRALQWISLRLQIPAQFINVWNYMRFVLLGFILLILMLPLYMLAQGRRRPLREIVPGAMASLVAWMVLSVAFSYYVESFSHYTELYGSIATIVVAMLWLYMSGTVLIMGAELNGAILERKSRKQSERAREEQP
ncbi:MAG: YihY/virulence factor BrkB family protein [Clostridiales bacterium]|nr:YihY/virulence factor BrkB family protein [Candidatus Cacconaster stercorequi]